jgi:DNA-binding NarL/FixJ family response regulator
MAYRVLIADDNPYVREVIRIFLGQREDVEVCAEAENGSEAVSLALLHKPHLMILDAVMPEMNGIEASLLLKKSLPDAKTILFTMYADAIPTSAVAAGVDVVLPKPEGITSLLKVVDDELRAHGDQRSGTTASNAAPETDTSGTAPA